MNEQAQLPGDPKSAGGQRPTVRKQGQRSAKMQVKGDRRVLHVLGSLSRGGIETWLVHMLRHRDMFSVDHEIVLTKNEPGEYEQEVREMGIPIHRLPVGWSKIAWLRSFRRFLEKGGPFAVVHSHAYFFSAPALTVAKSAGVRSRIAHCHTARSRGRDHRNFRHNLRRAIALRWLRRVATVRIGITEAAIEEIAGARWRNEQGAKVLLYGFDFDRNRGAAARAADLRDRLGIGSSSPVIGHVGRFEDVKNHAFLLEAFAASLEHLPAAHLVLVGDGPLRNEVVGRAASLGLADRIHFAGTTDDVAAFMSMFDLFVLPSWSEGLGIVCVEAQAAGTPVLASDGVPAEASVISGGVQYMPLDVGPAEWGRSIASRLREPPLDPLTCLADVEASGFGISHCIAELDNIYSSELDLRA